MILGCGIDSIEISRVDRLLQLFPGRFLQRVFTPPERRQGAQSAYYAKRFAAKEAALKAMGFGLSQGLSWHDLVLSSNPMGQPHLTLSLKGKDILKNHYKHSGDFHFHVSLCDTRDYAQAMVVLEVRS